MIVLAYFTVCLWIIPFGFFISITANDLVLPTTDQFGDRKNKRRQTSGLKAVIDLARESILPGNSSKRF
ncbi:Protein TEX261 [Trichoplax sp. H2]|nr:Protein TEX261 [Trichoplax sp. H2]|eukprot:RDD37395.1 Protein TEX261 [Trichoplax sp. H2]